MKNYRKDATNGRDSCGQGRLLGCERRRDDERRRHERMEFRGLISNHLPALSLR